MGHWVVVDSGPSLAMLHFPPATAAGTDIDQLCDDVMYP